MNVDKAYIGPLYLYRSLVKLYALNVDTSFSNWPPNGNGFGIHNSPVNPKDLPNTSRI